MKKLLSLLILIISFNSFSQDNSAVYVYSLYPAYEGLQLLDKKQVSGTEGYNNQPSFISNETLLFAANNNGQTDIAHFNLKTNQHSWINEKTEGGEYSPQTIPTKTEVAAVRLDNNGLQRLYKYSKDGNISELVKDLQVAYYSFYNDHKLVSTVLDGDAMDLVYIDLKNNAADTLFRNAGRSLQKVPKTNYVSYSLVNDDSNLDIYLLDMDTFESYFVAELPIGIQDCVWINDTQLLIGSGKDLYMYDTLGNSKWTKVASLEAQGLKNITRMAISPDGKKLALVAEPI